MQVVLCAVITNYNNFLPKGCFCRMFESFVIMACVFLYWPSMLFCLLIALRFFLYLCVQRYIVLGKLQT